MPTHLPRRLSIGLLILLGSAGIFGLWHAASTTGMGRSDFIGYWSAAHLLYLGQNPYDMGLMDRLQHTEMKTGIDPTIMAWNPPTLFVFLLPLAALSFEAAKFVWLLVNLLILLAASLMLARQYLPADRPKTMLYFLLFAAGFPPVLTGLYMGQATFLVFLGLVGCLALIRKGRWFWAGAALILTTIKPHMVILPVIYLLLYMLMERRYRGLAGLALAGAACAAVLFLFRLGWVRDLIGLMAIAPVHWATPTIGGLLSYWQISEAGRSLILLILPLPFLLVRLRSRIGLDLACALLTLVTVPTTFFGWAYDQVMLLLPAAQVFGWMARSPDRAFTARVAGAMALALALNFLQRALGSNEVYYLWVPLFWWLIFGLSWRHFSRTARAAVPDMRPA